LLFITETGCEICGVLKYYAAKSGNSVPTFRYSLSVTSSRIKSKTSSWTSRPLKMGPIGCPETSVRYYPSTLCNILEERRSDLHRGGCLKSRMQTECAYFAVRTESLNIIQVNLILKITNGVSGIWALELPSLLCRNNVSRISTSYIHKISFCSPLNGTALQNSMSR